MSLINNIKALQFAAQKGYALRTQEFSDCYHLRFDYWKRLSESEENELYALCGATIDSVNGNPKHDRYYYKLNK